MTEPAVMTVADGPWGPVHLAATTSGIAAIELMVPTDAFVARLERRLRTGLVPAGELSPSHPAVTLLGRVHELLGAYFSGQPTTDDLPLDLEDRPAWDRAVLAAVREVGCGSVTSYGRVARRIGRPGAGRAVGGAIGRNPVAILIPCHRVIAGDGSLGGYGGAWWGARERLLEIKGDLLDREGIRLPVRWSEDPLMTTGAGPGASGRPR